VIRSIDTLQWTGNWKTEHVVTSDRRTVSRLFDLSSIWRHSLYIRSSGFSTCICSLWPVRQSIRSSCLVRLSTVELSDPHSTRQSAVHRPWLPEYQLMQRLGIRRRDELFIHLTVVGLFLFIWAAALFPSDRVSRLWTCPYTVDTKDDNVRITVWFYILHPNLYLYITFYTFTPRPLVILLSVFYCRINE